MRSIRERILARNKHKAQKRLDVMFDEYGHNDIIMHLQIHSYMDRFCKQDSGELKPDVYIRAYIDRMESKLRDIGV